MSHKSSWPLPGDYLIVLSALALLVWLFSQFWSWQPASRLQLHQAGKLVATMTLDQQRIVKLDGPLGVTVVQIQHGRARILSSPCSNQYCVHRGWLSHEGDSSVCLPNRISIRLEGAKASFDSLNY